MSEQPDDAEIIERYQHQIDEIDLEKLERDKEQGDREIVAVLQEHGAMTVDELARRLGVDRRALTRRLPRMKADELLEGDDEGNYWTP